MADKPVMETVTQTRPVTGVILDLVQFARSLGLITPEQLADDAYLVKRANAYWEQQHGDEHG